MFKVNEYYDGKVKSLAYETKEGPATIGVVAEGEYEFGTTTDEFMTVTDGELTIQQAGETDWKTYKAFEEFMVPKNSSFKVIVKGVATYRCLYR